MRNNFLRAKYISTTNRHPIFFFTSLISFAFLISCKPQSQKIGNFEDFIASLRATTFESHSKNATFMQANSTEFQKMKQYLLDFYNGANVVNTFAVGERFVDCHTFDSQPGVRTLSSPDKKKAIERYNSRSKDREKLYERKVSVDTNGQTPICPRGSVPIVRQDLEILGRFSFLENYLDPLSRKKNSLKDDLDPAGHYYATYRFHPHGLQFTATYMNMGLWSPITNQNDSFSLYQVWVTRPDTPSGLQTIEVGFQVYFSMYQTNFAVPFVFSTSANYTPGSYCYNTCNTNHGIILFSPTPFLGLRLNPNRYSVLGNERFIPVEVARNDQDFSWDILFDGQLLGYYSPNEFVPEGQPLNAYLPDGASRLVYGGETAVVGDQMQLPQMGSGSFQNLSTLSGIFVKIKSGVNYIAPRLNFNKVTPLIRCYRASASEPNPQTGTILSYGGPGCITQR